MQALQGIKVVEFAAYAAGPVVGKHLADQGATVVHVESKARPDGFRAHYPPYKDNIHGLNRSGLFALCNSAKLDVTLNLKKAPKATLRSGISQNLPHRRNYVDGLDFTERNTIVVAQQRIGVCGHPRQGGSDGVEPKPILRARGKIVRSLTAGDCAAEGQPESGPTPPSRPSTPAACLRGPL